MNRIVLFLLLFQLDDALPQTVSPDNAFPDDMVLKFADHLFDQREYQRAILEYHRYLFSQGRSHNAVIFKTGLCYFAAKDFSQALTVFERLSKSFPIDSVGYKAQLYQILAYFNLGEYHHSLNLVDPLLGQSGADPCYRTRVRQLQTASYLALHEWSQAESVLSKTPLDACSAEFRSAYSKLTKKGENICFRNPFCAVMLSGMIPGMGKLYAGRTIDGVFSLMLIGVCAWQSYDGFTKNDVHSKKGWLWGTLGGIFYLGNIYGSYVAVKVKNQELRNEFLYQLQVQLCNDFRI